jgi:flagellar biosynthesis/type III secretory pathway M-ring protein FliF/YscJ
MDDGGIGDHRLADAAANLVSGAQHGLVPNRVKVVIGTKQYKLGGPGSSLGADEMSDQMAMSEAYIEQKVQGLYPYIQGIIAKVSVDIENKTSQLQSKKFDKDNVISKEKSIETRVEESTQPGGSPAEPGIVPNTGLSIAEARAPAPEATKSSEESKVDMETYVGESVENINTPAGKVTVVGASVRVPRTHFVEAFKKRFVSSVQQPDPAALQAYIDEELAQMAREVQRVTHVKEETDVTVALYDDVMPMMAATTTVPVGNTVATTVSSHAKEIAIGALAVISLFMVSTMVRKGGPAPIVAAAAETKVPPHLSSGRELAGEAGEGDSMLDGMELDEDAVRAQQMLEQVSTMVEENPDAAANIMKRWLNRS